MTMPAPSNEPRLEIPCGRTAEILPFPVCRMESGRFIAAEYARRPGKGRHDKADYASKVISGIIERLQRLGVSQAHIDAEIAQLKALFWRLDGSVDEKVLA